MADAVLARQHGDEYQAKFFWYKACKLYQTCSTATQIAWELNDAPGFDDVSIYYEPAKRDRVTGTDISEEYFQVKFHVDHKKGFTCAALIDPAFIGNKTESLLQRLYKNYILDPSKYSHSRYHIINTWGVDYSDSFGKLLDNNGAIRIDVLFDGTTDSSKMGVIRTLWRTHLNVTDDVLRAILGSLRVQHSAKGIEHFTEDLNFRLQAIGLATISETQRASVYTELIQRLHAEKRNKFSKEELMTILKEEKLIAEKNTPKIDAYKIGVRSFKKGTDSLSFETDAYLCLLQHFNGRFTLDENLWETSILPSLTEFAEKVTNQNKPLHIHLDTHQSIAFAFGYYLDNKCGLSTSVIQKTKGGRIIFNADHLSEDYNTHAKDINWTYSQDVIKKDGKDIVLILNVTHDIINDVLEFTNMNLNDTSKIISATIFGGPSFVSIRDGNHIELAVMELLKNIRQGRSEVEKKGYIHLFMAAPNAMAFSLGQNLKSLGQIMLYEYDFEKSRTGSYHLSLQLPIKKQS